MKLSSSPTNSAAERLNGINLVHLALLVNVIITILFLTGKPARADEIKQIINSRYIDLDYPSSEGQSEPTGGMEGASDFPSEFSTVSSGGDRPRSDQRARVTLGARFREERGKNGISNVLCEGMPFEMEQKPETFNSAPGTPQRPLRLNAISSDERSRIFAALLDESSSRINNEYFPSVGEAEYYGMDNRII